MYSAISEIWSSISANRLSRNPGLIFFYVDTTEKEWKELQFQEYHPRGRGTPYYELNGEAPA